jgi:ABC-type cobalamin/Fe3+-siderophores transport system ATPase subunit
MLAIVGNNGAGKSTLLKAISGIAKYQRGSMYYAGDRELAGLRTARLLLEEAELTASTNGPQSSVPWQ